ncbi:alpha/beta fold hydrolase [Corynebacterium guangdongense]|uniref:Pimeloyl-ACP methyl ester carboxylesterase n=1 Tax=Corynebacterium guangdongense TaxID=1783348 RepID=A0ABU1ZYL8_9CORY|nr:alpha/beta hydrolase [Corynebacterium guangdongense]MDR7329855.1 pimeloyl-ACP methyl ester carboxylesterase [Corynebacterium guangdongense]WJZ18418.1 Alpha/beta hydrolase family protein [Corynebacterium guangdongense]
MTTHTVVLVPGFWLGSWAWDQVKERLQELDVPATALTLPGLDPDDPQRSTRTPSDQAEAVLAALDGPSVVVAHSGANIPVTMAMDKRPDLVARVIWVDSGPVADGFRMNKDAPQDLPEFPLPDFDVLGADASLEGLDGDALATFRERSVPEPGAVLTTPVHLRNDARYSIPTTLVCNSLSSQQLTALAEAGHPMTAELAKYADVRLVDLPTGHWPMWSRPQELALIIAATLEN